MSDLMKIKTPMLKTYNNTRIPKTSSKTRRPMGRFAKAVFWILGLIALSLFLYLVWIRPWYMHWGASESEIQMALPGDEIVLEPRSSSTRAITIQAPVEQVWPWIVQMGYQRAGWYAYDWIERILGYAEFVDGDHSANRIVPELQDVEVGETMYWRPQISQRVALVEIDQTLLLQTGEPTGVEADPENYSYSSWVFYLQRMDATTTRLIVRYRSDYAGAPNWLRNTLNEPWHFIMEQKMMRGIRSRAEEEYNRSTE